MANETSFFSKNRTYYKQDNEVFSIPNDFDLIENINNQINSLLLWFFIRDNIKFLPRQYQHAKQEFDKVLYETKSLVPREKICIDEISAKMPLILAELYYKHKKIEKNVHIEIYEMLKNATIQKISNLKWMDDESKSLTNDIMKNLKFSVANSNFQNKNDQNETQNKLDQEIQIYFENPSKILDFLYQNYSFNEVDYFENEIQRLKSKKRKMNESILNGFSDSPIEVNAVLDLLENKMIFSPSLLQEPFLESNRPNYLNYGTLGFIIGHEIMHGLEFMDEDFCFLQCWTPGTQSNFNNLTKCIVDQYDNYILQEVNRKLNGLKLLKENIADNGALDLALLAYHLWVKNNNNVKEKLLPGLTNYSQEQIFFINYAQVWCTKARKSRLNRMLDTDLHSPNYFRVVGPIENSHEFSSAFNCNKKVDKKKKCKIW